MTHKKGKKKPKTVTIEESTPVISSSSEPIQWTTEPTVTSTLLEPLQCTQFYAYCGKCHKERFVTKQSIDWKGTMLLEMECGHLEAYEYKTVSVGDYAYKNYGK